MKLPPSFAKILKNEFKNLISSQDWFSHLLNGRLDKFEQSLYKQFMDESAPKSRFFEIAWKVAKYYSGYMLSVQLLSPLRKVEFLK